MMTKFIQNGCLVLYRQLRRTGIFSTSLGRSLYESAYWVYKRTIEARDVDVLRFFVVPGKIVVDVGANIGFYTLKFAQWVEDTEIVIAIEPEGNNVKSLEKRLDYAGLKSKVLIVPAAAAEATGELRLSINPDNPADHRLAAEGVPVKAITVDELVATAGWKPVSLIKIDVQGAEGRVLVGAKSTLKRFRPALFIEVDEQCLMQAGKDSKCFLLKLADLGYRPHEIVGGNVSGILEQAEVEARVRNRGYADFLFLAK